MGTFEVIAPGLFTTIQDEGRFGHQQSGVCVAGAMDPFAHKVANILCGNDNMNEAVLELTMMGATLAFHNDAYISITGGDLSPAIDGVPVKTWQSYVIKAGSTLSFETMKSGVRAYVGIFGGMDIPVVMGSKSTYAKAKIGGWEGRPLKAGDKIPYNKTNVAGKSPVQMPAQYIPAYAQENVLRVVLGPQDDAFTQEGIDTFLSSAYTVSSEADRMGYRLEGAAIKHKDKSDIISDAMLMGGIQVPGQGHPIILMADRQTTGGYTKIASVIYADLYKVAQAKAGDVMRFSAISIEEAQDLYDRFFKTLTGIEAGLLQAEADSPQIIAAIAAAMEADKEVKVFNVRVGNQYYSVSVSKSETQPGTEELEC
ncbi:MAG: biotin-dependent carboxyltransferase family protein [Spirochaetes bacterium]|nr:biotin-dependent carboxyltransferase family protein [Spirochaetota bacterium]